MEKGTAAVYKRGCALGEPVARLARGDIFGEVEVLHGYRRTETVVALTQVAMWAIDSLTYQEIVSGEPVDTKLPSTFEAPLTPTMDVHRRHKQLMSQFRDALIPPTPRTARAAAIPASELFKYNHEDMLTRLSEGASVERLKVLALARAPRDVLTRILSSEDGCNAVSSFLSELAMEMPKSVSWIAQALKEPSSDGEQVRPPFSPR